MAENGAGAYLIRKLVGKKYPDEDEEDGEVKVQDIKATDIEESKLERINYQNTIDVEGDEIHVYTYRINDLVDREPYDKFTHEVIMVSESDDEPETALFSPEKEDHNDNIEAPVEIKTMYWDEGERIYDRKNIIKKIYELCGSGNYQLSRQSWRNGIIDNNFIIKRTWISEYGPEKLEKKIKQREGEE